MDADLDHFERSVEVAAQRLVELATAVGSDEIDQCISRLTVAFLEAVQARSHQDRGPRTEMLTFDTIHDCANNIIQDGPLWVELERRLDWKQAAIARSKLIDHLDDMAKEFRDALQPSRH